MSFLNGKVGNENYLLNKHIDDWHTFHTNNTSSFPQKLSQNNDISPYKNTQHERVYGINVRSNSM